MSHLSEAGDPRLFTFGGARLCLGPWFLWETVSHVTRRRITVGPTIAWPSLSLAVGLLPRLVGILFPSGKVMAFGATTAPLIPAWPLQHATIRVGRCRADRFAALAGQSTAQIRPLRPQLPIIRWSAKSKPRPRSTRWGLLGRLRASLQSAWAEGLLPPPSHASLLLPLACLKTRMSATGFT